MITTFIVNTKRVAYKTIKYLYNSSCRMMSDRVMSEYL